MANEISWRDTATGDTLYATVRNAANQYWDVGAGAFETLVPASWDDYDIVMTETPAGGYTYVATFPAGITTAGFYYVTIYKQAGGSPALTDDVLASGTTNWDGSAEDTLETISDQIDGTATPAQVKTNVQSGMTDQGYTTTRAPYLDELATANIPTDIDSLLTRLTALRAGYLDELGPTKVPADIDTLISRLTAARAILMDNLSNLDVAVSTRNATAPDNTGITANGVAIAALNDLSQSEAQTAASAALTAYDPPTKTEMDTATQAAKLASDGLDSVAITEPTGVASNFREMVVQVWRRWFGKSTLVKTTASTGTLKTYKADGTTEVTSQAVSDDGTTETQGEAS